ncbi:MAG TPA: hypothetical protein VFT51_11125 [Bacillales bacterium]|nr:hypothetical protein [Bacillales bacterium]
MRKFMFKLMMFLFIGYGIYKYRYRILNGLFGFQAIRRLSRSELYNRVMNRFIFSD